MKELVVLTGREADDGRERRRLLRMPLPRERSGTRRQAGERNAVGVCRRHETFRMTGRSGRLTTGYNSRELRNTEERAAIYTGSMGLSNGQAHAWLLGFDLL